ncbi:MAG TPA: amino acid permease [Gemmatimonadaceae bacterium]|nr:amino acid permease [Gemmatimonadaceae bacterium]
MTESTRHAPSDFAAAPGELPRRLGLGSAIAVVVGITIGSGIFRTPASVTNRLPGPLPLFSVWIAGGIVALFGALTLAEVAGAFPDTGGIFVFIRKAWGRLPAFLFGWAELAIIRAAAVGAIATTFAEYLLRVLGFDPTIAPYDGWVHYVAAVAIAVIAALNYIGIRWGALVQNVTAIAKFFGLLFIVIAAIAIGIPRTGGHFTPVAPAGSFSIAPFGLALVSVLWAYDGWADLAFISGEVKDPGRNLPRALIYGTLAVIGIYILANIAYLGVMPVEEVRHSKLVAADVALRLIGPAGVTFISLTVMLSTLGTLNGSILTNPRVFFAMAADGLLFRKIAAVHRRFETPYVAIALTAVLGIIFVLLRTFEQLADTFVTAILPFYALGVASIFVFRRRSANEYTPPFRAPLYPIAPIVFVLATLYLLVNALIDPSSRVGTLAIFVVILLGIPVYYATVGRRPPMVREPVVSQGD